MQKQKVKQKIRNGLVGVIAGVTALGGFPGLEGYVCNPSQSGVAYGQEEGKQEQKSTRKYHPLIEDFEKRLEVIVSPSILGYYEVLDGGPKTIRENLLKLKENPKQVMKNKYYPEFISKYNFKRENVNLFGVPINTKNPSQGDKAALFASWIINLKLDKVEKMKYLNGVLDNINKTGRMPTKDYMNGIFFKDGALLEDNIADFSKIQSFPGIYRYFALDYDGNTNDGVFHKTEKLIVGINPEKADGVKDCKIELYGPKGKLIYKSGFKISDEIRRGEIDLTGISGKHGIGNYAVAFFVKGECFRTEQIEIVP